MSQLPLDLETAMLPLWSAVDQFVEGLLIPQDSALTAALADSEAARAAARGPPDQPGVGAAAR